MATELVPQEYLASETCDQGVSSDKMVLGDFQYQLTEEVLSPENIKAQIQKIYGSEYELASWDDLKNRLRQYQIRKEFLRKLGIPHQKFNFSCGNILLAAGALYPKMRYTFIAHHNGTRPKDWLIIDEIGGDDIHLGRWKHFGRALIKKKFEKTDESSDLSAVANTGSVSNIVIGAYQIYQYAKYCDDRDLGWLDMAEIRAGMKEMDSRIAEYGLKGDELWSRASNSPDLTGLERMFRALSPMMAMKETLPADRQSGLNDWCQALVGLLETERLKVMQLTAKTGADTVPKEPSKDKDF
ncbi:hypothetical protein IHQ71_00425 [Rhizobium sp. TH2]|uniref:hypothetical protein n=1 Tax=Rhizobium sp. TH2 TaxID=2775403 RepID=UPI002157AE70|nr:hypothetical protein [Rhizobium sp. TH2]UVC09139.1 hypothetical protein IHQ71_00425 [Rhizobium sp. TH2]